MTRLARAGLTLGTCESLTAGLVSATLASVPGASAVLRGGLVTYASDLKSTLAGVDPGHVSRAGVVNEPTVRQMAGGARRVLGVDVCLACTGVAGPEPQDGQPPGTVWIAVAGPGDATHSRALALEGDRTTIRQQTVDELFRLLNDLL